MGLRFFRTLRIAPGIRLNLSRSGISASVGPRGARVTFSRRGTHANLGLPGTGLSWRGRIDGGAGRRPAGARRKAPTNTPETGPWGPVAEGAGQAALTAALDRARSRRPYCDGLAGMADAAVARAVPLVPTGDKGRIGRGRFLIGFLGLSVLVFVLFWLRGDDPQGLSGSAFLPGVLALVAALAVLVARRSRAAGVPPWVVFLGIGLAAWLMPGLLAIILLGLLLAPGKAPA